MRSVRPPAAPSSLPPSWLKPVEEDPKKAIVRYVGARAPQLAGAEGRVLGTVGQEVEVQWRERGGGFRMPKAGDPRWFQRGELRNLHGYSQAFRRPGETWPEDDPDARYMLALRDALGAEEAAEEAFHVFWQARQADWLGHPVKIRRIFQALKHAFGEAIAVKALDALADIDMPKTRFQLDDRVRIVAGREMGRMGTVIQVFRAPALEQREVRLDPGPGNRAPRVVRESIANLDPVPVAPPSARAPSSRAGGIAALAALVDSQRAPVQQPPSAPASPRPPSAPTSGPTVLATFADGTKVLGTATRPGDPPVARTYSQADAEAKARALGEGWEALKRGRFWYVQRLPAASPAAPSPPSEMRGAPPPARAPRDVDAAVEASRLALTRAAEARSTTGRAEAANAVRRAITAWEQPARTGVNVMPIVTALDAVRVALEKNQASALPAALAAAQDAIASAARAATPAPPASRPAGAAPVDPAEAWRQRILSYIVEHPGLQATAIARGLGLTGEDQAPLYRELAMLVDDKRVVRTKNEKGHKLYTLPGAAVPTAPRQEARPLHKIAYAEVKKNLLAGLRERGWEVKEGLQTPWAEKDGTRLWFEKQAIYLGTTPRRGDAHSISSDTKADFAQAADPVGELLRAVERRRPTTRAGREALLLPLVRAKPGTAEQLGIRADMMAGLVVDVMQGLAERGLVSVNKSTRVWAAAPAEPAGLPLPSRAEAPEPAPRPGVRIPTPKPGVRIPSPKPAETAPSPELLDIGDYVVPVSPVEGTDESGVVADVRDSDGFVIVEHDNGEQTDWTHPGHWRRAAEPATAGARGSARPSAHAPAPRPRGPDTEAIDADWAEPAAPAPLTPAEVRSEAATIEKALVEFDKAHHKKPDPLREAVREAVRNLRKARGEQETIAAREALQRALAARAKARKKPGVDQDLSPAQRAREVVVEEQAAALSRRLVGKAPCATEEGVLAATAGEYRTLDEISALLGGCDQALVAKVLAKLYEQFKVRKTFTKDKPERWGHDVASWRQDWAVYRDGNDYYGDTAFLNAAQELPGFSVRHLGMGEFVLNTPAGEVEFDRMRGVDFPGQSGRSHLLYAQKNPEALALLLKEMRVEERLAAARSTPVAPPSGQPSAEEQPAPRLSVAEKSAGAQASVRGPEAAPPEPSRRVRAPAGSPAEATAEALAKSRDALQVTDDPAYAAELHRLAKEAHRAASAVQAGGIFAQHNRLAAAHGRAEEAFTEAAKRAKALDEYLRETAGRLAGKRPDKRAAQLSGEAKQSAREAQLAADAAARILEGLEMAFRGEQPPPVSPGPGAPAPGASTPSTPTAYVPLEVNDLWSAAKRRDANLAAMRLAADLAAHPRPLTSDDRRILSLYSGWGGLDIEEAEARGGFPAGFHRPSEEGLIHEFYTPTKVCLEVARVIQPLLGGVNGLAAADGYVHALEPSCGIARFVRALGGPGFENVRWHAVEYSPLTAAMVRALLPELDLFEGPFQRWVAQNEANYVVEGVGRLNLVVCNPPYGGIGTEIAEDPRREYRRVETGHGKSKGKSPAYKYFLRRSLDLLAPGGLGVYLIPAGFLSGTGEGYPELRKTVLLRHHLACAYRLPGEIFPGAHNPAFDLVFFRARPGRLKEPDAADLGVLQGRYFDEFPQNVLGQIVHDYGRWKTTAVVGEFTKLPDIIERPICAACAHIPVEPPRPPKHERVMRSKTSVMLEEARLASASSLGLRVNWYLAALATQESETPVLAWGELHRALTDWARNHGAPSEDLEVVKLAIEGDAGAQAFLAAFVKGTTRLIPGLETRPTFTPRYTGAANDMLAKAEYLYRQRQKVSREDLGNLGALFEAGWAEDEPGELHPPDVYYYGALWPKYDRARARAAEGDAQAERQAKKLLDIIKPAIFDDIRLAPPEPPPPPPGQAAPAVITPPPPSWFPVELLAEWLSALHPDAGDVELERAGGVLRLKDVDYETMGKGKGTGRTELLQTLGWLNHDKYLFTPPAKDEPEVVAAEDAAQKMAEGIEESVAKKLDDRRMKLAETWSRHFVAWAGADADRRAKIEQAYQRAFQGYRTPEYSSEPLDNARWYKGVKLSPHQCKGARRALANRRGLVAFDVGVGKTYTGLGILAGARQEGWVKRPVILVPASIIWKWDRDIRKCLPDYRVGIVGSKRKTISRGDRKGYETSDTDTPEERARTWRSFQAGEYDVVLMTYEALARTKMRDSSVTAYARETAAIERQMTIRRRNLKRQKKLTAREQAVLNQGVAGWVAELLEIPEKWQYDPGIIWEDLGIDLLIVDEAQNFKNLYMPEARAGGVPKYMGSEGEGSGRAWQLDFRCASVRANTGGSGIVLLSATPAKNSPVEFYNLIQLVDHDAWKNIGINNPEEFIDLFCQIESEDVVNTSTMRYQRESVCAGFTNLDMLRSVVFRYGEFKTAEEVGLRLPKPTVTIVEVDMTDEQEQKYSDYLDEIAEAKAHFQFGVAAGYRMRLPLVAIHPDLDEGYTWPSDAGLHEAPEGVQDPTVPTDGVVLPVDALAIPKKPKRVAGFGSTDPFKVLGLTRKATDEEIRSAYRQLALEHHPDRNPGDAKAEARFKEIKAAYDLIGEPKKRTEWLLQAVNAAAEAKKKEKRSAAECPNPHSPKFDALVKEILARPGCGHIVFCDNIAAHWWIRACLLQAGMKADRIAVMNGITAKEVAERQKLAIDFNGDDGDAGDPARGIEPIPPIPPKYDVIIGNGVMHEGVDLQRRTCAIHHLDLPYEPATLQQRNGRGHRQGNKFTEISIFYYFARRSSDGGRYQLIKGKLGWMTALLDSSKRDTNNPGAQSRMSKEEEAIFESRDPEATRRLIEAAKAAHQAALNAKIAHEASATLRGVVERFWRARNPREDEDPVRLRAEAELGIAKLARVSPEAWPWMSWAMHARDVVMLVPLKGESPVYPGLRLAKPSVFDPTAKDFIEFGRVFEGKSIGARRAGAPTWTELDMQKVVHEQIKPEHVADTWPGDDDDLIAEKMREIMPQLLKGSTAKDTWNKTLGWHWASDPFLERQWPRFGPEILAGWRQLPSFWAGDLKVPVLTNGVLSVGVLRPFDAALPPTEAGFAELLRLALASKATWTDLDEAARFWWGRTIPRNLVAAREKAERPTKAAA